MGSSNGFSQSGGAFCPAVACSAIARLCIPRRPRCASLSPCPGLNGADCGTAPRWTAWSVHVARPAARGCSPGGGASVFAPLVRGGPLCRRGGSFGRGALGPGAGRTADLRRRCRPGPASCGRSGPGLAGGAARRPDRRQGRPARGGADGPRAQGRIAQRFQLAMLPGRPPDLRRGRALYRQACAACHGADGTPRVEHLELPTRPTAFSSRQEVARLSPQRIFAAVSFGVPGTAMPSFSGAIDENTMWDVAFAALLFAHPREEQVRGEAVARKLPRRPDWLQLAVRTDEQLRATLSHGPFPPQEREALISAIRSRWIDPPQRA